MNQSPQHSLLRSVLVRGALVALAALVAVSMVFAGQAEASAGAYRVLLAEVEEGGAKRLQAQVAAFPDVAAVDLADTSLFTPTAGELKAYDLVVSIGDSSYANEEAWGNSLADYVDAGGIVVQSAYDTWIDGEPTGRWASGGYPALIPGETANEATTLGSFDATSPLMQGIAQGSLASAGYKTENEPAPGASVVARWIDGTPAIAIKGRAIGISAFIGGRYDAPGEPSWTGNYGQVVVNAARMLAPPSLTVLNSNPAGGIVTSTVSGISCGSVCSANLTYGSPVGLVPTANKGFAFAGFSGACTGSACALTMDGAKSVAANFTAYKFGKVKLNRKKGTAKLTISVGAPGALVVSGKKIKKRSKVVKAAGKATIAIVPKGKALKALAKTGKAKVKVKLAYTPTGGSTSILTKRIGLKLVS